MKFRELLQYHAGDYDCNVRSYSGRGMYSKECLAICGSDSDISDVFRSIIQDAASQLVSDDMNLDQFEEIADYCFEYQQDSMGLDVVYYWPRIEFTE